MNRHTECSFPKLATISPVKTGSLQWLPSLVLIMNSLGHGKEKQCPRPPSLAPNLPATNTLFPPLKHQSVRFDCSTQVARMLAAKVILHVSLRHVASIKSSGQQPGEFERWDVKRKTWNKHKMDDLNGGSITFTKQQPLPQILCLLTDIPQ